MIIIRHQWFIKSILVVSTCFFICTQVKEQKAFLKGWYPHQKKSLMNQLQMFDKAAQEAYPSVIKNVRMAIVPHAGWKYSGVLDAACFRCFDKKKIKKVIILAPLHHIPMRGIVLPSYDTYRLSCGTLKTDKQAIICLKNKGPFQFSAKKKWIDPHTSEHSIEVLLPFIYYYLPQAVIIPLMVGTINQDELQQAVEALEPYVTDETALIVSSDFTHYGPLYDFTPCEQLSNKEACIIQYDDRLIRLISECNAQNFLQSIKNNEDTICGKYPITLALALAKNTTLRKSSFICVGRTHSQIINKNSRNRVSYVGMVFIPDL